LKADHFLFVTHLVGSQFEVQVLGLMEWTFWILWKPKFLVNNGNLHSLQPHRFAICFTQSAGLVNILLWSEVIGSTTAHIVLLPKLIIKLHISASSQSLI